MIWTVRGAGRFSAVILLVGWIGLAAAVSFGGNLAAIVIWVGAVPIALGAWRLALVPYVLVGAAEITVQNPFSKVTLQYSQVRRVRAGYYGLTLVLADGRSVTAWAVQKSNWARWRHSPTRADEVADAITAHLGPTEPVSA